MWKTAISQLQSIALNQSSARAFSVGFKQGSATKNRKATSSLKNTKLVKGYEKTSTNKNKKSKLQDIGRANYPASSNFDESVLDEEELDEEVDIYKYHHIKKLEEQEREKYKEFLKLKIVEKKYFKKESEKVLSWSDKEHIRYLHNTDPQKWTHEVLADQFQVEPRYIKAISKAKWIPKKSKEHEETLKEGNSSLLLKEPFIEDSKATPKEKQKLSYETQKMSFKEFCTEIGAPVKPKLPPVKPTSELDSQNCSKPTQEEILLKYITGEAKDEKWASSNENVNLYLDEDHSGNVNVYHYDHQHGYQHPFGKIGRGKDEENTPLVREGELFRRGDAFYDEDGEFLFRVPGLSGK